jgi:starch synthase
VRFPGFELSGRFLCGELFPGVDVALLDIPALFDRAGLYGDAAGPYPDEALRFITLARAAAYRAEAEKPDVVVAHDWHAALALPTLRTALDRGRNREIGVVQTVHNNAYQGRVHVENYGLTGLANDLFHAEGLEAYGSLCMLKGGTMWADRVVAVSPTYAREIQTPAFGEGLEGAYQSRAHRLTGIVNGIDTVRFDPSTDRTLPAHFRAEDPSGKDTCRRALLEGLGLDAPAPGLLCAGIGRFAPQKGWDVLAASIDGLVELGATLVLLGDGDPWIARLLEEKRKQYPKKVSVRFGYDDAFARRIYAGADAVLVPSRFEPCGLVQLIAQRYGAVPIAHAVGGLVDTIVDPVFRGASRDDPWKRSTGILFAPLSPDTLISAVARCAALGESGRLPDVQRRLLELDVSWDGPAALWETLFAGVADEARRRR